MGLKPADLGNEPRVSPVRDRGGRRHGRNYIVQLWFGDGGRDGRHSVLSMSLCLSLPPQKIGLTQRLRHRTISEGSRGAFRPGHLGRAAPRHQNMSCVRPRAAPLLAGSSRCVPSTSPLRSTSPALHSTFTILHCILHCAFYISTFLRARLCESILHLCVCTLLHLYTSKCLHLHVYISTLHVPTSYLEPVQPADRRSAAPAFWW